MQTLNLFTFDGKYVRSVCQSTHEECMAIAKQKYPDLAWFWDSDYRIKKKTFVSDTSTEQRISLEKLFG